MKIVPGTVIVPVDRMRRPWGELISLDLTTRTGVFRQESDDKVVAFTVMPYAELLHHATFGDLQDFKVGERAIFRLHENDKGEWILLTYIQDEMNFLVGHKEYYHVEKVDVSKGQLVVTDGNVDKTYVRTTGIVLETDGQTRYWKNGEPAKFWDIRVGDKLRTQTHGIGVGKTRVCWEVFLDDDSVQKFQAKQRAVHARRMKEEGLPGYVDRIDGNQIELTLFQEAREESRLMKAQERIRLAPAGTDRKPLGAAIEGTVTSVKMAGNLTKVALTLDSPTSDLTIGGLARLKPGIAKYLK